MRRSRIGDLEAAITNVATLTSQSINSILEKGGPARTAGHAAARESARTTYTPRRACPTVSHYVSQTILQASINIICFLVKLLWWCWILSSPSC